jgi:hypothetical protein
MLDNTRLSNLIPTRRKAMPKLGTVFPELLKLFPRYRFEKAVERRQGDRYVKTFSTWQQFITILYSQIKQKDSLRDIESGLATQSAKWYHIGLSNVRRSTLSDANNQRDYKICEDTFYHLPGCCRDHAPKHRFRFRNSLYTIDATTIDLCLSVLPWARFRKAKGAIKMHCLYDHSGALPSFMVVTDGKKHDVRVVKENNFPLLPDSIVSVDKAYIDYKWLNSLDNNGVWFVTRAKTNIDYAVTGQHPVSGKGVLSDRAISLRGPKTRKLYPGQLRLARIYKSRWQIELFFKWIKQNLKIKSFLGASKNAVMTQAWVAMCYYLLLAYIKYQTKYSKSMLELRNAL